MASTHRLVIVRHSKSSWASPEPDHARPLNKRGQRDGVAAGQWLAQNIGPIDHVLCSTAKRTRLTWEHAQAGGTEAKGVSFHDDIYENTVPSFKHLILGLPENVGTAVLVGHWPGVVELAQHYGVTDEHPGWAQMDEKFPTSAIAVLDFSTRWNELETQPGKLSSFVIPRG